MNPPAAKEASGSRDGFKPVGGISCDGSRRISVDGDDGNRQILGGFIHTTPPKIHAYQCFGIAPRIVETHRSGKPFPVPRNGWDPGR
jgi:hypothetical protein